MASSIMESGVSSTTPPHGGSQHQVDTTLIACAVEELASLNNLIAWVGRARDFIAGIETGRRLSPEFATQLKSRDFDYLDVEWSAEAADGLAAAHSAVSEHLTTICKALRGEVTQ